MRTLRLRIYGSDKDLNVLAASFPDSDPRVFKGEVGSYWMTSRRLDEKVDNLYRPGLDKTVNSLDRLEVYRCARVLLHWAVGAVRCSGLNCSTVRFIRWWDLVNEDGSYAQIKVSDEVELATGVPFSYQARDPSTAQPDPAFVSRLVQLAWTYEDVGEALKLLSYEVLDWVTLYKVFEIVRWHTPGGERTMTSNKWISRPDLKAFTAAANRPEVGGPMARHARMAGQPPRVQMSLPQARIVIPTLVRNWCDALA